MRTLWLVLFAVIAMLGAAGADPARAEDFNFTINVKLSALLPAVNAAGVSVFCLVNDGPLSGPSSTGTEVGRATVPLNPPDANGNLTQSVTVRFNATPGRDPATGRSWYCTVLFGPGGNPGNPAAPNLMLRPKAGTEVRTFASGTLP